MCFIHKLVSVNAHSLYQYVAITAHHVVFDALPTRCTCDVITVALKLVQLIMMTSWTVVFVLLPTKWTCTSVCSISMTDHGSDGKCSSSVVVFNLMPTR